MIRRSARALVIDSTDQPIWVGPFAPGDVFSYFTCTGFGGPYTLEFTVGLARVQNQTPAEFFADHLVVKNQNHPLIQLPVNHVFTGHDYVYFAVRNTMAGLPETISVWFAVSARQPTRNRVRPTEHPVVADLVAGSGLSIEPNVRKLE